MNAMLVAMLEMMMVRSEALRLLLCTAPRERSGDRRGRHRPAAVLSSMPDEVGQACLIGL
jgi:hypothetical protein